MKNEMVLTYDSRTEEIREMKYSEFFQLRKLSLEAKASRKKKVRRISP